LSYHNIFETINLPPSKKTQVPAGKGFCFVIYSVEAQLGDRNNSKYENKLEKAEWVLSVQL
jgi:hypothetical protein